MVPHDSRSDLPLIKSRMPDLNHNVEESFCASSSCSLKCQINSYHFSKFPLAFQFRPIASTWTSQEHTCHLPTPTFLVLTISRNAGHVAPYKTNTIVGLSITTHSRKNVSFLQTIVQPYRMVCIGKGNRNVFSNH